MELLKDLIMIIIGLHMVLLKKNWVYRFRKKNILLREPLFME
jgi:hypothetical protein